MAVLIPACVLGEKCHDRYTDGQQSHPVTVPFFLLRYETQINQSLSNLIQGRLYDEVVQCND